MSNISVIIPTCYPLNKSKNLILSLMSQSLSKDNFEIIVVDNNSCIEINQDPFLQEFRNKGFNMKYVKENKEGLHNARHKGVAEASNDIILFLDDDIIASKNLLIEILRPYQDNPKAVCVGGKVLPKWEVTPPDWINYFPLYYLSLLDKGGDLKEIAVVHGCNFSIKKSILLELKGFNPDGFLSKDKQWLRGDGEIGLLKKIIKSRAGKIIYNPKAIAYHFIPKDKTTIKYYEERLFREGIERSFCFYRKKSHFLVLICCFRFGYFGFLYIFFMVCGFLFKFFNQKYSIKFRVYASRFQSLCLYGIHLYLNREMREFIRRDNWLM